MIQFTKNGEFISESEVSQVLEAQGYEACYEVVGVIIRASETLSMSLEPMSWAGVVGQLYKQLYKTSIDINEFVKDNKAAMLVVSVVMYLENSGYKIIEY
jgi:hypothetical protein